MSEQIQIEPIIYSETDAEPVRVPVTIGKTNYALIEASEDVARKYRNKSASFMRMNDGKVVGIEGVGDIQSYLLHHCLFELNQAGEAARQVPESTIRGWTQRIVKNLFDTAKRISHLDETKDVEPQMVDACRRDMALKHHPDIGGDEQFFKGVNAALDWLKKRVKEPVSEQEYAKNSPVPTMGTTS